MSSNEDDSSKIANNYFSIDTKVGNQTNYGGQFGAGAVHQSLTPHAIGRQASVVGDETATNQMYLRTEISITEKDFEPNDGQVTVTVPALS